MDSVMFSKFDEYFAGNGEEMLEWLDDAKNHIENNWEMYEPAHSFINDRCKVADMLLCSRSEFLEAYSYITEKDYDTTLCRILDHLQYHGVFSRSTVEEHEEVMAEREV